MKRAAIEKCDERLRRAQRAVKELYKPSSEQQFRDSWDAYLSSVKAICEILRVGAKGEQSQLLRLDEMWKIISEDDLLRYLIEARNTEEHGLDRSAHFEPPSTIIGGPGESFRMDGSLGNMRITPMGGSNVTVWSLPQSIDLLSVIDKKGREHPVPTRHLGQELKDCSPAAIAEIGLRHFMSVVEEARAMPKH